MKVQDENSVIRGSEVAKLEGRMTKFQLGDHEKLPSDHPLMVSLLVIRLILEEAGASGCPFVCQRQLSTRIGSV